MRTAIVFGLLTMMVATIATAEPSHSFYFGADLSYVNEMEDCGAVYREHGVAKDPFAIFKQHGANLIRVRLWNDARWTHYSDLSDVKKTIRRAREQGIQVLLDFHYSDDWADGEKQIIPEAWAGITDVNDLAQVLYNYTYDTLASLDRAGLMPDMVQVGNETNLELMGSPSADKLVSKSQKINWQRNAMLFNAGIHAVRDAAKTSGIHPKVMLHIAQPENVESWFLAATQAGVTDFDVIGISYYRKWSTESMQQLGGTIRRLRSTFKVEVMVAETAYPWTLQWNDSMPNLLGNDSLIKNYPATPAGQLQYLVDLTQIVIDNGGNGVVYWEPAWLSTQCRTRWGQGSAWENATFFDFKNGNELLPAIDFMGHNYAYQH